MQASCKYDKVVEISFLSALCRVNVQFKGTLKITASIFTHSILFTGLGEYHCICREKNSRKSLLLKRTLHVVAQIASSDVSVALWVL